MSAELAALTRLTEWAQAVHPDVAYSGDHPIAVARKVLESALQADPWHTAVLNECMLTEACYQEADPAATVKRLIDWHVANGAAVQAVGASDKEVALIEKAVLRVGMKSLMNHGAASCVYTDGCEGVSQEHLIAFAREIALHTVAALSGSLGDGGGEG